MTTIIAALRQGDRALALTLIHLALPCELNQPDEYGQTALHLAIQKNYLEVLKILLEKGAHPNARAKDHCYGMMTPLHYAALTGNLSAAKLLLKWGANPQLKNGHAHTPLSVAYQHGFIDVARAIERYELSETSIPQKQIALGLNRKFLELKNSSLEALEARNYLSIHLCKENNVINLKDYRGKKNRKK